MPAVHRFINSAVAALQIPITDSITNILFQYEVNIRFSVLQK